MAYTYMIRPFLYSTIDTKLYEHFKNIYHIANFIAYFYFFESKIENFIGKKDDNILLRILTHSFAFYSLASQNM